MKSAIFNNQGKPTADVLKALAGEQGLDVDAFGTCLDEGKFAQRVKDQMAFGRTLGVTGTPGNIVINNETGDFVKVSGAVPATSFDTAVSGFINE